MTSITRNTIFVTLLMILLTVEVFAAPDYAREKRWADEVVPGLIDGDPIYLKQANAHEFLGLYAKSEQAKTGVVVVHGMGIHPDWGFIGTLRQQLYDFGYTTLSIQMPVLAADASYKSYPALFPDAVERLSLAVRFLKEADYEHIVIVSHSNGSRMSRVYMSSNPPLVNAWVALSLTQGDSFDDVTVPVLDLYGENDLSHVLDSSEKRRISLFENEGSQQIIIPDANHFFSGQEDAMILKVKLFIDRITDFNSNYSEGVDANNLKSANYRSNIIDTYNYDKCEIDI